MGKYMRKAKMTGDVAVMDVSQSSLGVRTRAKTLALQRLQSAAAEAPPLENPESCYLELRSRRLEKSLQLQNSRKVRRSCDCKGKGQVETRTDEECCGSALISCSIEADGLEVEASFGENNLDAEARETWERSTRESTPCSSTRVTDTVTTPGYTMKQTCSSAACQRPLNALLINVPTPIELEEFFACEEQSLQRLFTEKYNFDFVNDSSLPGRYEWVKVSP